MYLVCPWDFPFWHHVSRLHIALSKLLHFCNNLHFMYPGDFFVRRHVSPLHFALRQLLHIGKHVHFMCLRNLPLRRHVSALHIALSRLQLHFNQLFVVHPRLSARKHRLHHFELQPRHIHSEQQLRGLSRFVSHLPHNGQQLHLVFAGQLPQLKCLHALSFLLQHLLRRSLQQLCVVCHRIPAFERRLRDFVLPSEQVHEQPGLHAVSRHLCHVQRRHLSKLPNLFRRIRGSGRLVPSHYLSGRQIPQWKRLSKLPFLLQNLYWAIGHQLSELQRFVHFEAQQVL